MTIITIPTGTCLDPLEAIYLATLIHAGQVDKAGASYFSHCWRVLMGLSNEATEDEQVAAVLHDAIEDAGETVESLAAHGVAPGALAIIESLTRRKGEQYSEFIERVARAGASSVRVKLADIADNMDPARLALLDEATRERLERKYTAARERLLAVIHPV